MVGTASFARTICSICYEDLKPLVEDLQAIPLCGHVFHELCLQQWFEYCSSTKNCSCPVCKQTCSEKSVGRLYFQSIGEANNSVLSQKPSDREEDCEALRRAVKILEVKVTGLSSALEQHQKDRKELNEKYCLCKEAAEMEAALKIEALKQKASVQKVLHSKSEELEKSALECLRLQHRNMGLAKELATLKLASDLNLEEDEVLKLASFGNDGSSKDTIEVLKRSLVIRNKSYKELMSKCNLLGRGEARSLKKLDKAKEKIRKLKTRLQELETAIEIKDNEVLRALKISKKDTCEGVSLNTHICDSNSLFNSKDGSEHSREQSSIPLTNVDKVSLGSDPFCSEEIKSIKPTKGIGIYNTRDKSSTVALDQEKNFCFLIEEDISNIPVALHEHNSKSQMCEEVGVGKSFLSRPEAASAPQKEAPVHRNSILAELSSSKADKKDMGKNEEIILLTDDVGLEHPLLGVKKETSFSVSHGHSGDRCFTGGLLGPDGTNRYLGKWCKRLQNEGAMASSVAIQGSSASTGDLIAIGADGRGGKIKVLRSQNQSSVDTKESSGWAKRCKYGSKTSSSRSQGCLQIEHFFGKASH